jgi:hypothetical protein
VDNIIVATDAVPLSMNFAGKFENGNWRMDFDTMAGWSHSIYRTEDFVSSFLVGTFTGTNYGRGTIIHTNPPASRLQVYKLSGFRL